MTGHVDIIYQQSRNLTIIYHLQESKKNTVRHTPRIFIIKQELLDF